MNKKTISEVMIFIIALLLVCLYLNGRNANKNELITSVKYICENNKTISADYYQGETKPSLNPDTPPVPGGSVKVVLDDGINMLLPQTISADGARYANLDESFIFWSKGNSALILENNKETDYKNCILISKPTDITKDFSVFGNGKIGFSIEIPKDFQVDEKYSYQAFGPGKEISGVKFAIPASIASGTNLANDSYISVEQIPQVNNCDAKLFISNPNLVSNTINDSDIEYSFASSTDAGLGNRYEETIYAIPGTNPCMAVRYFVHYGVIENYPEGMVKQFDREDLLKTLDIIRRTLVVGQ